MNDTLFSLLAGYKQGTLDSLQAFMPELVLTATIVLMLLVRMPGWGRKINSFYVAFPGTLLALAAAAPWIHLQAHGADACPLMGKPFFDGMLMFDELTVFFRSVLLLFAVLFLVFTKL